MFRNLRLKVSLFFSLKVQTRTDLQDFAPVNAWTISIELIGLRDVSHALNLDYNVYKILLLYRVDIGGSGEMKQTKIFIKTLPPALWMLMLLLSCLQNLP